MFLCTDWAKSPTGDDRKRILSKKGRCPISEYHSVDVEFQDEQCLVEALNEVGWTCDVHATPVNLEGYQGDKRSQKAHIVIPRKVVGGASNDIGFERQANGKYEVHVSAYDKGNWTRKAGKIKQLYTKNVMLKQCKNAKFKLENQTTEADGTIAMKIRVRR